MVQEQAATTIQMTPPVVQEPGAEPTRHVVAFVMPAEFTLDTLPTPSDPRIGVREVPEHVAAVASFTGRWTERTYRQEQLPDSAPLWSRPASRWAGRPASPASIPRGLRGSSAGTRWCCRY